MENDLTSDFRNGNTKLVGNFFLSTLFVCNRAINYFKNLFMKVARPRSGVAQR